MESSKKILLSTIGIAVVIVLLSGITFAFFNYTRIGAANTIKVGRMNFITRQTETINLTNIFPIASSEATGENPNYDSLVIEIEGDTDYNDGIEYLVSVVDANIYTSTGQTLPISLDITVDGLGTSNSNYFIARESKNSNIYKKLVGDTIVGDEMLLVGYIKPNTTSGQAEGIDGSITIKAYIDKDKILISDTYDGTESDNMGTTNAMTEGKTVLTTEEWNAMQNTSASFKVKVEANEGIWVVGSLEEIMRTKAVMDNINSDYVNNETPGVNFGEVSSDTNGKGVYMRAGTENDDYPIMYYRGDIIDNNVLFGNRCWKAVRTTDTGGVKLIYNGELSPILNEELLDIDSYLESGENSVFDFNENNNTLDFSMSDNIKRTVLLKVPAGNDYSIEISGTATSQGTVALSIYKNDIYINTSAGGGGMTINYNENIGALNSDDIIRLILQGSATPSSPSNLSFKLTNDNLVLNKEQYSVVRYRDSGLIGCDNVDLDAQISLNENGNVVNVFTYNSETPNSPAYAGYMYGDTYSDRSFSSDMVEGALYGSSFMWDGANYKLVGATVSTPDITHRYTCNSPDANATCMSIRYILVYNERPELNSVLINGFELNGGDDIEKYIKKMNENNNDSIAKSKIDAWYSENLALYTNKLEDTIWCNDRTGLVDESESMKNNIFYLQFDYSPAERKRNGIPYLNCLNKNDAFTVSNIRGNRKLTYPVALLTSDEIMLAGYSSYSYLKNGVNGSTWTMSPSRFYIKNSSPTGVDMFLSEGSSDFHLNYNIKGYGFRPAISLKPGQLITQGTGTVMDPYVIE